MIRASQLSATEKSLCANKLDLLYKKKSHRQWTNPGLSIRFVVITYIILSAWNSAFGTLSYGLEFLCFRLQFLFKWFSNNRFAVRFSFMHVIPIVGRLFQRVVVQRRSADGKHHPHITGSNRLQLMHILSRYRFVINVHRHLIVVRRLQQEHT
jgi:hypothetical protein